MIRLILAAYALIQLAGCASTNTPAPVYDHSGGTPRPAAASGSQADRGVGYYTVKRGDTLYGIALEHGQDYREIAQWNNLENPSLIKEGQQLRVTPPGVSTSPQSVASRPLNSNTVQSRPLDPAPAIAVRGAKRDPKANKEPYSEEAYNRLQRNDLPPVAPPKPAVADARALPPDLSFSWPANGKVIANYVEGGSKGIDIAGNPGDPVIAAGDGKVVYAGSGLRGYGQLVIVKHDNNLLTAYAHNQKILVREGQPVTRGQRIAEMGNTDADLVKLHFEVRRGGKPVDPAFFLPRR